MVQPSLQILRNKEKSTTTWCLCPCLFKCLWITARHQHMGPRELSDTEVRSSWLCCAGCWWCGLCLYWNVWKGMCVYVSLCVCVKVGMYIHLIVWACVPLCLCVFACGFFVWNYLVVVSFYSCLSPVGSSINCNLGLKVGVWSCEGG